MSRVVLSSERSMRYCREQGWRVGKVETFVPPRYKRDLFGWMDLVVLRPELVLAEGYNAVVGVQSCAMARRADHLKKYRESPEILAALRDWLAVPYAAAEIWSWRKLKVKRGGKAEVWRHEVTNLEDLL